MNTIWTSICRIKIHEFRTTLRHIKRTGVTWHDIYTKLGELQKEAIKRTMKQSSALLVSYLLLVSLSDPETVSVTIQGITASVPTAFVTVVASVTLFAVMQGWQSVYMIILIRSLESTRLRLHGFSANAYGLFNDQDEMALVTPVILNGFIGERLPISRILATLAMLVYLSLLLPLVGLWVYLFQIQFGILQSKSPAVFFQICATFGLFVLASTALTLILFNMPLPMKKRPFSIRWGFLFSLSPIGGHPRADEWLADTKVQDEGP